MGSGTKKRASVTAVLEAMESRRLLSAGWTTTDDFQSVPDRNNIARSVVVDAAGNAYAAGSTYDTATRATVRVSPAGATTWATAGSFGLDPSKSSAFKDIAAIDTDASGSADTLYAVGTAADANSSTTAWTGWWITAKSIDQGATWIPSDQFKLPGSTLGATANAIEVDAAGNIYVVGEARDMSTTSGRAHWVVRKSADGGVTWRTLQDFTLQSGYPSSARDVVVTASGVYVVGEAGTSKGVRWVVQKAPSGGPWTTVDSFQLATNDSSTAEAIAVDSNGSLFTVGAGHKGRSGWYWVTRKAGADGAGWATVDNFRLPEVVGSGWGGHARAITTGPNGNVYVAGTSSVGYDSHAVVRHSSNGGATWQTSDNYILQADQDTQYYGIGYDRTAGRVIAAGGAWATNSATGSITAHWIIREMGTGTQTPSFSDSPVTSYTQDDSARQTDPITTQILA